MKVLALDTATRTGWAMSNSLSLLPPISSGVEDFTPDGFGGWRFRHFRDWLVQRVLTDRPDLIVYESIVGGVRAGGNTALIQKGLEAIVLEVATTYNVWSDHISVWSFAPATIKKWATGSGVLTHESKQQMVELALRKWRRGPHRQRFEPHRPTKSAPWPVDDNQCDALWLLDLTLAVKPVIFQTLGLAAHEATREQLTQFAQRVTIAKWSRVAKPSSAH